MLLDHPAPFASGSSFAAMSCPSAGSCLVVPSSTLESTTDPKDANPHWTTISRPGAPQISRVSCASTSFCVAVDQHGGYTSGRDPQHGPWTATQIGYTRPNPIQGALSLTGVSCEPNGSCIAGDGIGEAITGHVTG